MSDYATQVLAIEQSRIQERLDQIAAQIADLTAEQATLESHLASVSGVQTMAVAQAARAASPVTP